MRQTLPLVYRDPRNPLTLDDLRVNLAKSYDKDDGFLVINTYDPLYKECFSTMEDEIVRAGVKRMREKYNRARSVVGGNPVRHEKGAGK